MDEWRKAYINYRGLKKLIKRVDEHYELRQARNSQMRFPNMPEQARNRAARLIRRGTSVFKGSNGAPEYKDPEPGAIEDELPEVSLKDTGLSLLHGAADIEAPEEEEPQPGPSSASVHSVLHADGTKTNKVLDGESRLSEEPEAYAGPTVKDLGRHRMPTSWVVPEEGDNDNVDIHKLIKKLFDSEERKFFYALDDEVARIVHFYEEREREAIERLSTLVTQLSELAEHRREFKAKTNEVVNHGGLSRIFSAVPVKMDAEGLQRARLNAQHLAKSPSSPNTADAGDKRRAQAIEHMQALNIGPLHPQAPGENQLRIEHDPVRYKAARKKLREAVIENYRALEILNNYRILNRTGFTKILKKFDKTLNVETLHPYYSSRVMPTPLVTSETVPKLLRATEEIFTSYFEHGDSKRARDVLREPFSLPPGMREHNHHQSVFRTGVYLGVALCATIQGLRDALDPQTQAVLPQWKQLLQLYAAEFIPTLFALLFGLNLAAWQHVRINTVFIFEWDAGNALEPTQYFEMPAIFLLLLSIFFWVSFASPDATDIAPTTWPLVWLVIVLLLLLNPLPMLHSSSRRWFVKSICRVFGAGIFASVEFRDFFLGDELNSLAYSMSNLWFLGCEYHHHFHQPDVCPMSISWWVPVLTAIPAFLRFVQCFRRYADSRGMVRIHLVNAGKYASSILNAFFYFNYRHHNSQGTKHFVLWIVFAAISSIFTSSWDLIMDWNLLQRHSKYPLLRTSLAFEEVWPIYYFAIVSNVFLRFIWVIYLFGGPASLQLRSFLAALLEMLRRWQWNFIRLENEHIGNADSFKIVRDCTYSLLTQCLCPTPPRVRRWWRTTWTTMRGVRSTCVHSAFVRATRRI